MAQHNIQKEPATEEKTKKITLKQLKEVKGMLSFIRPYRWHFIGGLILLFFGSLTFMAFPYLAGELADVATGTSKLGMDLNQIGLILIVILLLQGVMSYLRVIWFAVVSEKGVADVRSSIYQKLIGLPVYFFERNRVGDLTSRISEDVNRLSSVFSNTLAELIRQVLILITGIVFLMVTTPRLSLTMLATFPVIVVGAMFFGRYVRNLSRTRQKSLANTNTVVEETLQNINTVQDRDGTCRQDFTPACKVQGGFCHLHYRCTIWRDFLYPLVWCKDGPGPYDDHWSVGFIYQLHRHHRSGDW